MADLLGSAAIPQQMTLPSLKLSPIHEVVCGVAFDAIPGLDAMMTGIYWAERREDYPQRQLHGAVHDQPSIMFGGVAPIRSWFISDDEVFVLQMQPDRFYLNWRARGGQYPRFNDRGAKQGILSRFVEEFGQFSEFCGRALGSEPKPNRIEMTKIDHFLEGLHWEGFADLAILVPWLEVFAGFSSTGDPAIALRFNEQREKARLSVALDTALTTNEDDTRTRLLKLETQIGKNIGSEQLRADFLWANNELNEVFAKLVSPHELKRFGVD